MILLPDTMAGLLAATVLKTARPQAPVALGGGAGEPSACLFDYADAAALERVLPGMGETLRRAAAGPQRLVVRRQDEDIAIDDTDFGAIAGPGLRAMLRERAAELGVAFLGAAATRHTVALASGFAGHVECDAMPAHDCAFLFADQGMRYVHGRLIGLGQSAVLRAYGATPAEAEDALGLLRRAFDIETAGQPRAALGMPGWEASDLGALLDLAEDIAAAFANDLDSLARLDKLRGERALANQHAARNLDDWYGHAERYRGLSIARFAYSMLSASQRVGHDELARRFPQLVGTVETEIVRAASGDADPRPSPALPMFAPFSLRGMTVPNRVVVSPMCMYSATEGMPDDFHLVHLGARALGGAGLVIGEMTAVSEEGRISPGCAGIYSDAQATAWQRIVDFVHRASPARIGLQLGHAGPKASTQLGWQRMDAPLKDGNWPIVAASGLAYGPDNQVPQPLDGKQMARIERAYADAARRAAGCGFDMLELHAAHGYLLSSFISPLTNRRDDDHGGSLANRLRFPLRVFAAIRAAWPEHKPITVRISAHDWVEGGTTGDDAVTIAAAFKAAGADAISVSTGQTTRQAKPLYGRMYQVPFADRIRNEVGIPTIAVGAITDADQVNTIVAAGRADLCALARPHLANPHWTLHAALDLGVTQQAWPKQYVAGRFQAERELGKTGGQPARQQVRQ